MTTPPTPSRPALASGPPVHHLAIVVSDLVRSEAFYARVLGLEVSLRHADPEGAPRSVWLRLGEGTTFLALERGLPEAPRRRDDSPGIHCLALPIAVDQRAAWRAHLAHSGYPVERESSFTLYVRDPDACLVALSHHPTPADL